MNQYLYIITVKSVMTGVVHKERVWAENPDRARAQITNPLYEIVEMAAGPSL